VNLWFKFLMVSGFLFLLLSVFNPCVFAFSEDEAALVVNEAEETLASTFEAVKEAETNGADISAFSELLKDATQLLSQAYTYFRVGDFDKAEKFANLALEIGREVKSIALSLGEIKSDLPTKEMWDTVIGSVIAVFVVVIAGLLGWIFFRRLYYRRKSVMKPEVASVEY
jgi:tetratricopeptide (TPR) repeat protein